MSRIYSLERVYKVSPMLKMSRDISYHRIEIEFLLLNLSIQLQITLRSLVIRSFHLSCS